MILRKLPARSWFYLRVGYTTYLGFILSFLNFIIIVHTFVVSKVVEVGIVLFALVFTSAFLPLTILIGWMHMKNQKMKTYEAEIDIGVEANKYNRQAVAGKERFLQYPMTVTQLTIQMKMMAMIEALAHGRKPDVTFTENDYKLLAEFKDKCQLLADGGEIRGK